MAIGINNRQYARILAVVYADGINVACAQLASGQTQYIARWDNGDLVAQDCPDLAL